MRYGVIGPRSRLLMAAVALTLSSHPTFGVSAESLVTPVKLKIGNATVSTPPYTAYTTSVPLTIYFKEEGIDATLIGLGGATVAVQALDTGQVDIALPANAGPLALLERFPNADVVAFYTFINGFQSMPVVLKDSPIKALKELSGKMVGVQTLGNSQVQTTKALVQLAGSDPATIKFVAVGEGPEAAHALESKRIDALALFDGLYGQIESAGIALRELSDPAVSKDKVGFVGSAIAKSDFIKTRRDVAIRYGRALAKSAIFARENPEAAIRIHWKVYPATRPRGVNESEALRQSMMSLRARLENVYPVDDLVGFSTKEQIDGYVKLMRLGGLLTKEPPAAFWNPSLIKEINDFDIEAVKKQAREWKE